MSKYSNTNNEIDSSSEPRLSCHLFEKFLVRYPGSQKESINLILGEKVVKDSFYSKLCDKLNIYEKFNLSVHSLTSVSESVSCIESGVSFIIASCKELDNFKNIDNDPIYISKKSITTRHNIGYQRHLGAVPVKPSVSLGEYKQSSELADALIRKSDTVFFNIDAVRKQDSFSNTSDITGFDIYEACTISRSAGLSSGLQLFCMNMGEEALEGDREEFISLMFWYFLEGCLHKNIDTKPENNTTYLVQSELSEDPIQFTKSKITKRWSFVHPIDNKTYPCTEEDYNDLIQGQIPDIILAIS